MNKVDFLVVGAGLFGSVFAHEATKAGKKCLVIDQRSHIGGNCYTENQKGIEVHKYGPHIFQTNDKKIWDYINCFGKFNDYRVRAMAVVGKKIYNLPFGMDLFSQLFGITRPHEAMRVIDRERKEFKHIKPKNLEEYAIKMVGKTIYTNFIKGYTEKAWRTSCKNLPIGILKRIPIRFIYNADYSDNIYQGVPIGGYTKIFEQLLKGIDVRLNTSFKNIRNEVMADKIIYTGTIDEYFDYRLGVLEYRSLEFVNEERNCPYYQGCALFYYPDADVPFTRSTEYKLFVRDTTSPGTIISYEFPVEYKIDSQIPYYPIRNNRNIKLYNKYLELAKGTPNVYFGGRLGSYKYCEMDDTIKSSLRLASLLLKGGI